MRSLLLGKGARRRPKKGEYRIIVADGRQMEDVYAVPRDGDILAKLPTGREVAFPLTENIVRTYLGTPTILIDGVSGDPIEGYDGPRPGVWNLPTRVPSIMGSETFAKFIQTKAFKKVSQNDEDWRDSTRRMVLYISIAFSVAALSFLGIVVLPRVTGG